MPIDEIEDAVDRVVSPERITRWIVRILLLFVLIGVAISAGKLSLHWMRKVDTVTTDRDWFVRQQASIESSRLEERAAREALDRHLADVQARSGAFSISHSDDRVATQRLNQQILDAQRRRLLLVQEYNARAGQAVDPSVLAGLPTSIEINQER